MLRTGWRCCSDIYVGSMHIYIGLALRLIRGGIIHHKTHPLLACLTLDHLPLRLNPRLSIATLGIQQIHTHSITITNTFTMAPTLSSKKTPAVTSDAASEITLVDPKSGTVTPIGNTSTHTSTPLGFPSMAANTYPSQKVHPHLPVLEASRQPSGRNTGSSRPKSTRAPSTRISLGRLDTVRRLALLSPHLHIANLPCCY
jgi:hypothetical protein